MSKKNKKKAYQKNNRNKIVISKNIIIIVALSAAIVSVFSVLYFKWSQVHLQVPALFAANTVLQRNKPVRVYGKGKPVMTVTVEIAGKKAQSRVGFNGLWELSLPALQAGGPFLLKISSAGEVQVIEPVYVGDVWFVSGQSNMLWYVDSAQNATANIIQADQFRGKIFWFQIKSDPVFEVKDAFAPDLGAWVTIDSNNIKERSAVAYAFAKAIYKDQQVPIGIIQSAYGNTKIRSWMSTETLRSIPSYQTEYNAAVKQFTPDSVTYYTCGFNLNRDIPSSTDKFRLRLGAGKMPHYTAWFNNRKLVNAAGLNYHDIPLKFLSNPNSITVRVYPKRLAKGQLREIEKDLNETLLSIDSQELAITTWGTKSVANCDLPSSIYNAMINPVIPYTVSGILWYQGETDVREYQKYPELFMNFIEDLRSRWKEQLPVFYVQLHSYKSPGEEELLPRFREMQDQLLKRVPDSYMITAVDLADAEADIHSRVKDPVGHRLALAVRKHYYREAIQDLGPRFSKFEKQGNVTKVYFNDISGSLVTNDQSISVFGFSVAGKDQKFYPADAKLQFNTVALSSTQVPDPVAIRYAWSDMQRLNLYDSAGLSVRPFRTDSW